MQIKLRNRKCAWTKDGSSLVFSKHCFRGASFFPSILKPLHSTLNSLKATGSWKYIPRMKMHSNERPEVNASSIGRKTTNKITYGKCSLWWRSFFLFFLCNANISTDMILRQKKVAPLLVHQHFNVRRIKKTVLFTFYVMFRIVNGNWIGSFFV